ncbi:MAG: trehalose-phosphatase [Austwickia sp.]|nr:trehalose-phosphatase [Austwickia sp.]
MPDQAPSGRGGSGSSAESGSRSAGRSDVTAPGARLPGDVLQLVRRVAALPRIVLATDFDGTLAPFVQDPMQARPAPEAVQTLRAAASLPGVTTALVSGRDLRVLQDLSGLADVPGVVFIGTHGAQSSRDVGSGLLTPAQAALLAELDTALQSVVAAHPGSRLERKPAAVVLHTRGMPEPANSAALAAAGEVASAHPGAHPLRGKDVQEIGVIEASKGTALRALAADVGADATVYLGDDVTDELAFAALDPARGDVTVKVGEGETAAVCRVADIPTAVAVLAAFVAERGRRTS